MVRYKMTKDVSQLEPHVYLLSKQAFNAMVKTKVMPEATYGGNTDGSQANATANTEPPSNPTNDPTVVETTQLM